MPDVVANGVRLFYQQTGAGPDVVLVHAVTSNQAVWVFAGLPEAIAADGFRVTTYDLRGHGASDRPPAGYTSADMAEDFRQLHAALGLEPAVLIGPRFGGEEQAECLAERFGPHDLARRRDDDAGELGESRPPHIAAR